jgi:hypothetical protein
MPSTCCVDIYRMLQGPYGGLDKDKPLIRLPFTHFAVGTVLLALTGLLACLALSLLYHFEESTYTHCHVSCVSSSHVITTWNRFIESQKVKVDGRGLFVSLGSCCRATGTKLPPVHQRVHQPGAGALHLVLLHRPLLLLHCVAVTIQVRLMFMHNPNNKPSSILGR